MILFPVGAFSFTLSVAAHGLELPPIDRSRPAEVSIATFALG